jgi:hypothetical protein
MPESAPTRPTFRLKPDRRQQTDRRSGSPRRLTPERRNTTDASTRNSVAAQDRPHSHSAASVPSDTEGDAAITSETVNAVRGIPHDVHIGEALRRGLRLYTREVAAIIHETCLSIDAADATGRVVVAPTADDLWVTPVGVLRVAAALADAASLDRLVGLAALIEQLLPPFSDDPNYAVRGSMRIVPARLRAKPGLSCIANVGELLQTISIYETDDPARVLEQLANRVEETHSCDVATEVENALTALDTQAGNASIPPFPANTSPDSTTPANAQVMASQLPVTVYAVIPPASIQGGRRRWRSAAIAAFGVVVGFALAQFVRVPASRPIRPHDNLPFSSVAPSPEANDTRREPGKATNARVSPATGVNRLPVRGRAAAPVAPPKAATKNPGANTSRSAGSGERQVRAGSVPSSVSEVTDARKPTTPPSGVPTPLDLPVVDGAFSPSFASTGTAVFFHAGRDRDGRLLEADLDTQGRPLQVVTMLADGAKNYHPRLSPDERRIAFDSDRDGERGVYIAGRDGSDVRRVSGTGFAAIPTWSPDMKWLAFVRAEPHQPHVWNLWRHDLATGELRRLTSYRYGQTWAASWFPDARRICYSHENQLVVLDITTGATDRFASPRADRLLRTPAVSPDGGRIVFQVYRDGVWLLDLQTRRMRRIIDDPTAEEFAWNPQGTRVAYHSRRGGDWRIWVTTAPS